jgi:hypothetical protein
MHCNLAANEKKAVGGVKGGESRKQQMADGAGGDVHAAYSEMGTKVRNCRGSSSAAFQVPCQSTIARTATAA